MGAYWKVYLGVYLEVQVKQETRINTYYIDNFGNRKDTPFCPITGAKHQIKTEQQIHSIYPNPNGFEGVDEDEFFSPAYSGAPEGYVTWIPNKTNYQIATMGQFEDNKNHEINIIDITDIKRCFVQDNIDYLNKVGKKFNFTVKFGLIHYSH